MVVCTSCRTFRYNLVQLESDRSVFINYYSVPIVGVEMYKYLSSNSSLLITCFQSYLTIWQAALAASVSFHPPLVLNFVTALPNSTTVKVTTVFLSVFLIRYRRSSSPVKRRRVWSWRICSAVLIFRSVVSLPAFTYHIITWPYSTFKKTLRVFTVQHNSWTGLVNIHRMGILKTYLELLSTDSSKLFSWTCNSEVRVKKTIIHRLWEE